MLTLFESKRNIFLNVGLGLGLLKSNGKSFAGNCSFNSF